MKYKVISLARTPERLEKFYEINSHTSFEWTEGVDGQTIDINPYIQKGWFLPEMKKFYTKGVFGLAITEIQLWHECAESNECMTICCDDVYLNKNFPIVVGDIDYQPDFWDLIMWGANPDQPVEIDMYTGMGTTRIQMDYEKFGSGIENFKGLNLKPTLFRCLFGSGTICYTINPRSAQWMIENVLPVKQYSDTWGNYGLDHTILYEMNRMNTFMSIPFLAAVQNDGETSLTVPPRLTHEEYFFQM